MTTLICDVCGKEGAHIRRITRSYGKKDNLLVIEDVPIVNCPHCGESYMTAEQSMRLNELKCIERNLPKNVRCP